MIDEVICYIEEPPQIDCEIQTVKIEWQNEYYPFEGLLEYEALDFKEDTIIETAGHYFTEDPIQNITIRGHGLDYYFDIEPERKPQPGEEYVVIEPSEEETILKTKDTYLDYSILVKPTQYPIFHPPTGGYEQCLDGYTLATKNTTLLDDIIIKPIQLEYKGTGTSSEPNTIYIGSYEPQNKK